LSDSRREVDALRTWRKVTVRRFSSNRAADEHERQYGRDMPDSEQMMLTWTLSREQWELATGTAHEPGLHRSVATVRRR
jgi:hypothetical protein